METDAKLERLDVMQTDFMGSNNLNTQMDFLDGNSMTVDTSIDKKSMLHALARRGEKRGLESPMPTKISLS